MTPPTDKDLDELPKENVYGDIRFDPTGNYRGVYNSHCEPSSQGKDIDKLSHCKDKLLHSKDKDIGYVHSQDKNFHSKEKFCS